MKKILILAFCVLVTATVFAQENPKPAKPPIDLSNRPNDHLLFQFGYTNWSGTPDTINTSGFSKSFNGYFLFDFPFKTNPKISVAFGAGVGSDHILFSSTHVGIRDPTATIHFTNTSDTTHYKKTKLATVFLEAPIELRFSADPAKGNGVKAAIGVKVGVLINAHTRNVKLQDKNNQALNDFVMKESSKHFFNKSRLVVQGRLGYSHFSIYGSYQVTPVFRDGFGPVVRPYSIGLTLSGL